MNNPLLKFNEIPAFNEIRPEHAREAVPLLLDEATKRFTALEDSDISDWHALFDELRALDEPVDYAWGIVGHFMSVMNSEEWRKVYEELQPKVVAYSLMCGQSRKIYDKMVAIKESSEYKELSPACKRILTSAIRGARLSGVSLNGKAKEEFNEIQNRLSKLSTLFSNNLIDSIRSFSLFLENQDDVKGLPESLRASMAAAADGDVDKGPWKLTIDGPTFVGFMKFSERPDLREKLYRAYMTKASAGDYNNTEIIAEILKLRQRKSNILGFESYAQLSIESKMAPSVESVESLLEELRKESYSYAEKEFGELRAYASENGLSELSNWDISFWSERRKKELYDYDEEDLRPYFQFEKVLSGMFELADTLFDITIENADGSVPVWHDDVKYFVVKDKASGQQLASFYLDPYVRPGLKRDGAWMNSLWGLDKKKGRLPIAYIVCNQSKPMKNKPSLMTFTEVNTLFHEFGHALQHMLTTVEEPLASGIQNIEWDAVELPSQFMENWCYHKSVLIGLSEHFRTGESLPFEMFDKIHKSRNYMSGSAMLRQLYFGILDMHLHNRKLSDYSSILKVKNSVAEKTTILPPLPEDRFLCSFSHIFAGGYAAGYYSYKWAEVLSADAFAAFEEAGLEDSASMHKMGLKFRDTVLALGGSESPMDVFKKFRGREPDIKPLLKHSGLVS